jgi:polyisoprenyl-phosphate glycosyltransferase
MQPTSLSTIAVLIPVYNDWEALSLLLPRLDRALQTAGRTARVCVVDDGSTVSTPAARPEPYLAIEGVDVLVLRRNLGHQRAIAIGLAHLAHEGRTGAVVVMDGDGEDAPEDVPRLLASLELEGCDTVVFAERRRRSEGPLFAGFYAIYRWLHWLLTGIPVRVGNFSALPARHLQSVVVVSEVWNHYAAAIFKAKLPRTSIPTTRAQRLCGQSRMNFVSLVGHGLSALSVHAEVVGVRLLVVVLALSVLMTTVLVGVIGIRIFTDLAIPGWATMAAGLLLVLLSQAVAFAVSFVFLVLHARSQPLFIPARDYQYFVREFRAYYEDVATGMASTEGKG